MNSNVDAPKLSQLAAALAPHQTAELRGDDVAVSDVHLDSRSVDTGSLYVAIRGSQADGHDFIEAAMDLGAIAVAVERTTTLAIPQLIVEDTRAALGWLAAEVHGHPARKLRMVGITGTNGKTTVAHMMSALTAGSARQTAVIGTMSTNLPDTEESPRTTPEASNLQRMLRRLAESSAVTDVAVEVSSHAMEMGRVNGVEFDVVAFTNLSQDHLDYHETMESYYRAKAKLFSPTWASHAVIWTDDDWGKRLAAETTLSTTTVGTGGDVDVRATNLTAGPAGSSFDWISKRDTVHVTCPLAGKFNVANAAIALACAEHMGMPPAAAASNLSKMSPIPGRYNTLTTTIGTWIVVDYAHTPDAIANVVAETRSHVAGKITVVVGAGGDRDMEKRPLMGQAAGTADFVVVTNDNPRSEDPDEIIASVVSGIPSGAEIVIEKDRRLAIRTALAAAGPDDAVLILGKGHEKGQEFAGETIPFDDSLVAREEIARVEEAR